MPIIGFYCQVHRANVPLDHFNTCDAVHADFAAAIVADSKKLHREGVYVTNVLGCPRKAAIESFVDVYVDPLGYNSRLGGAAWHKLMEQSSDHPELCEVPVGGRVEGVELVGRIDRLHPPTAISDWKVTSEWAEKWLNKSKAEGGGIKDEHLAQMSLYGELVEQSFGWRPTHGIVWYRTHKAVLHFAEELWDLPTVLAFHPLGGDYSVAELLEMSASKIWWEDLPLAGESMKYGQKMACDYCSVRDVCYTQARGAPF